MILMIHNGQLVVKETGEPIVNMRLSEQQITRIESGQPLCVEGRFRMEESAEAKNEWERWHAAVAPDEQIRKWRFWLQGKLNNSPGFTTTILCHDGTEYEDVGLYEVAGPNLAIEWPPHSNQKYWISWLTVKNVTIDE